MASATSARIHPSAVISPDAQLADGVEIGPHAVVEGQVRLGSCCVIKPGVYLRGPLTMGAGNVVFSGAVLGEQPQHLQFNDADTTLEIGDHNIFREHVTVHRGTAQSRMTKIGSHNFFMANSHVAHDCRIGDHCILANGALVGGHCTLADSVYLSGNCAVHQFVRLGRLSLLSGCSATSKDIPPFVIQQGHNAVMGINVIGMRRAGLSRAQIDGVRQAYRILFREGLVLPAALARLEKELGDVAAVVEMIDFLRQSQRGINTVRERHSDLAA
jgi:UDP-N-acetylglucosamine acyltransferase